MQASQESIMTLKQYVDHQLECHEAALERLKKKQYFHTEEVADREWNVTVRGKELLWEIKVQIEAILEAQACHV